MQTHGRLHVGVPGLFVQPCTSTCALYNFAGDRKAWHIPAEMRAQMKRSRV